MSTRPTPAPGSALTALRLGLAAAIALAAGLTATGSAAAPGAAPTPELASDLALDALVVLSGLLLTRSALRVPSLRRWAWHRALRTGPLLAAALLLGALGAGPLAAGPLAALPAGLACCALLAALRALRLLHRPLPLLLLCGALQVLTVAAAAGHPVLPGSGPRFPLALLLGAAAAVCAHRVPLSARSAALSAAVLAAGLVLLPDHRALAAPAAAHLVVLAATRLPVRAPRSRDATGGVLLAAVPAQQLVLAAGGGTPGTGAAALGAVLAVLAGALWRVLVERPLLRARGAAWVEAPLPGTGERPHRPHIRRVRTPAARRRPRRAALPPAHRAAREHEDFYAGAVAPGPHQRWGRPAQPF